MTIRAVLIDFSGTLFRADLEFDGLIDADGKPLDVHEQAEIMRRMTAPVGIVHGLPADLRAAWDRRDLDPEAHEAVYLAVLRASGLNGPGMAEKLYDRLLDAASWQPYPDTAEALHALERAHVPVAVISNIAWDIRPTFELYDLAGCVDEFVLSYRVGAIKPDPAIFRYACDRLAVAGENTLMIGDSREADGGAAQIGSAVAIVDPLPVDQRPDALIRALAAHNLI